MAQYLLCDDLNHALRILKLEGYVRSGRTWTRPDGKMAQIHFRLQAIAYENGTI